MRMRGVQHETESATQRTGIFATRNRADLGTLAEQRVGVHVALRWLLLLHCAARGGPNLD